MQVVGVWSLLKPLQQAGGQVWEEPGLGIERWVGRSQPSQAGSRQQAGMVTGAGVEDGHRGKQARAQKVGPNQGTSPGSMLFTLILQEGAEPASTAHSLHCDSPV